MGRFIATGPSIPCPLPEGCCESGRLPVASTSAGLGFGGSCRLQLSAGRTRRQGRCEVAGCRDRPLWPCPSVAGDSMGTSAPSPAPQAPLGSRGRGRKGALCLGRGRPRAGIQGAAPSPRNVARLRDPRNLGAQGPRRAASAHPGLCQPLSPAADRFLPWRCPSQPASPVPLFAHLSTVALSPQGPNPCRGPSPGIRESGEL